MRRVVFCGGILASKNLLWNWRRCRLKVGIYHIIILVSSSSSHCYWDSHSQFLSLLLSNALQKIHFQLIFIIKKRGEWKNESKKRKMLCRIWKSILLKSLTTTEHNFSNLWVRVSISVTDIIKLFNEFIDCRCHSLQLHHWLHHSSQLHEYCTTISNDRLQ